MDQGLLLIPAMEGICGATISLLFAFLSLHNLFHVGAVLVPYHLM